VETRELTVMLSSSCSSSDGAFALREEEEDEFVDSSDLDDEQSETSDEALQPAQGCDSGQQQVQQLLPRQRVRPPSRLALMGSGEFDTSDSATAGENAAVVPGLTATPAATALGKPSSTDQTSVISESAACGLGTAMSLGSVWRHVCQGMVICFLSLMTKAAAAAL